jgi:hypothetical protein
MAPGGSRYPDARTPTERDKGLSTKTITLTLLPVVAAAFVAGCSPSPNLARVCTDQNNQRVPDDRCGAAHGGLGAVAGFYGWYYLTRGGAYPAVGQAVQGGSRSIAPGARSVGVSERGGFGASAEAHGSTGKGGFGGGKGAGG